MAACRSPPHRRSCPRYRSNLARDRLFTHLFLANVLVLSWADYSYVQPASSVGYGVAALLGYLMLGEPVSPLRWLGIGIICLGVFVVGQTSPRSLERSSTGLERSPTGLERS